MKVSGLRPDTQPKLTSYKDIVILYDYMAKGYGGNLNKMLKYANQNSQILKRRRGAFKKRYPRGNFALNMVKQVPYLKQSVRMLKGIVNAEKQYHDVFSNAAIGNTGQVIACSQMAQGDDQGNRQGNSILAKSLLCRITFGINAAATITNVRAIFFVDTENTGTNPTVTDVLDSVAVTAPISKDHTPRYVVLRDNFVSLGTNTLQNYMYKDFIKLGNLHIKYTGPLTTDIYKNQIYLLLLSDQSTNTPQVIWSVRLGYYDN